MFIPCVHAWCGAQEVAESPYSVVVAPGEAHGPASSAFGAGVEAAVATLENTFYVQVSRTYSTHMYKHLRVEGCAFIFRCNVRETRYANHASVKYSKQCTCPFQNVTIIKRIRVAVDFVVTLNSGPASLLSTFICPYTRPAHNAVDSYVPLVYATTGKPCRAVCLVSAPAGWGES